MQTISFAFLLHIQGMSKVQPGNQELSFLISRWQYSRWHLDLSAKVISCHFFCSRIFPLSTLSLPSVLLLSWLRRQPPLKGTAVSSTALWCGQGQLLCPSAQQLTDLESFVNPLYRVALSLVQPVTGPFQIKWFFWLSIRFNSWNRRRLLGPIKCDIIHDILWQPLEAAALIFSHFLSLLFAFSPAPPFDEVCLAVAGRTWEGSGVALVLSDWALAVSGRVLFSFFGGGGAAGSQRKNSCRSVLTASGHSIMIMWLPSCRTFRKPIRRIYRELKAKKKFESSSKQHQWPFCAKAAACFRPLSHSTQVSQWSVLAWGRQCYTVDWLKGMIQSSHLISTRQSLKLR